MMWLPEVDTCAGIGGFSLAAKWAGIETTAQVELDEYCRAVLAKNFPLSIRFNNLHQFTYAAYKSALRKRGIRYRAIGIVSGGIPCQPFSDAGRKRGKNDARHLWPALFGFIRQARPRWVVVENVTGFVTMDGGDILEHVLTDLESVGYQTETFVVPALAKGAPHRRDRVWIVAHLRDAYNGYGSRSIPIDRSKFDFADTYREWKQQQEGFVRAFRRRAADGDKRGVVTNATGGRCPGRADNQGEAAARGSGASTSSSAPTANPNGKRRSKPVPARLSGGQGQDSRGIDAAPSHTGCQHGEIGGLRGKSPSGSAIEFDYSDGQHAWSEHWLPVASRLCRMDDGLPARVDGTTDLPAVAPLQKKKAKRGSGRAHRLKALGNAIVPQIAFEIYKAIIIYELENYPHLWLRKRA